MYIYIPERLFYEFFCDVIALMLSRLRLGVWFLAFSYANAVCPFLVLLWHDHFGLASAMLTLVFLSAIQIVKYEFEQLLSSPVYMSL